MTDPLGGFADLDLDRSRRRGYPEAVYCAGKTVEQVGLIAERLRKQSDVAIFTRAGKEHAAAVLAALPDALHDVDSGLLVWPGQAPRSRPAVWSRWWPPAPPICRSRARRC